MIPRPSILKNPPPETAKNLEIRQNGSSKQRECQKRLLLKAGGLAQKQKKIENLIRP